MYSVYSILCIMHILCAWMNAASMFFTYIIYNRDDPERSFKPWMLDQYTTSSHSGILLNRGTTDLGDLVMFSSTLVAFVFLQHRWFQWKKRSIECIQACRKLGSLSVNFKRILPFPVVTCWETKIAFQEIWRWKFLVNFLLRKKSRYSSLFTIFGMKPKGKTPFKPTPRVFCWSAVGPWFMGQWTCQGPVASSAPWSQNAGV